MFDPIFVSFCMNKSSPQSCLPLLKCLERDLYLQVKSVQNMQQLAQLQINDAHKTGADHTWSRICVTSSAGKLDLELSLFGGIKSGTGRIVITDMIWKHRTGTLMRPNPTKRGLLLCFLPGGIFGVGGGGYCWNLRFLDGLLPLLHRIRSIVSRHGDASDVSLFCYFENASKCVPTLPTQPPETPPGYITLTKRH